MTTNDPEIQSLQDLASSVAAAAAQGPEAQETLSVLQGIKSGAASARADLAALNVSILSKTAHRDALKAQLAQLRGGAA